MDLPRNATWLDDAQADALAGARRAARWLPEGLPVVQSAVRSQLARMFGTPDLLGDADPDSPLGFLPPGAPSRRVLAEPASIAGGVRSLFVQAAHPLAMAGVTDHSRYRSAPLERLSGTSAWVTTVAYGTVETVHAQARRVRAMHRKVVGTHDGRPYAASDPRLLVWVSIALTSSLLASQQLLAPRTLARGELDLFVAEQSLAAGLLDPRFDLEATPPRELARVVLDDLPLVDEGLPRDVAGLADVLASFGDELEVIPQAREAIAFLYEVDVPLAVRPAYRSVLDGVAATIPADLRVALGRADLDVEKSLRRLGAIMAGMRATTGRSPSYHASEALIG